MSSVVQKVLSTLLGSPVFPALCRFPISGICHLRIQVSRVCTKVTESIYIFYTSKISAFAVCVLCTYCRSLSCSDTLNLMS